MTPLGDIPPSPHPDESGREMLRLPPHSIEAEQSVLGGLLLDNSAWQSAAEMITAADFYRHEHQLIFSAVQHLVSTSKVADVITVFDHLKTMDQGNQIGGLPYLISLAQSVPSAANMTRYAEIVRERSTLRSILLAVRATEDAVYQNLGPAKVLDDAKVSLGRLADQRQLANSQRIKLMGLEELREHAHAVTWLVKHVVPSDSIGMIFGGSGTFKSFIALDFALHVAHGLTWMGRRTKQGPVLYIAAEGGGGLYARIVAWHRARRLPWDRIKDSFRVIPRALDLTADAWRVVESAQSAGHTPVLTVIDTLSQTYSGEENSAQEMAAYFREIGERFRALWRCSVAILHHTGHQSTERPRGSSAIRANLDWMLSVHRDEKEMLATLGCYKQKDGEAFQDAMFAMSVHELGLDEDGDKVTSLVARHLSSADELQDAMDTEAKAGRGGSNHLLLSLLQNGGLESDLRQLFYRQCNAETADARRQAYNRAKSWATKSGFMEVSGGFVITLKNGVAA